MLKHVETNTEDYYIDEYGNIQGECKSYYQNGKLRAICNCVNGRYHGEFKLYHDNGELDIICNYVNDEIHGEYKAYHDNGQIEFICNYVDGEMHGEYKSYYEDGELCIQVFYHMGKHVDLSIHGMDIDKLSEDEMNLLRVIYA